MKLILSIFTVFIFVNFGLAQGNVNKKIVIKLEIKTVELDGNKVLVDQNGKVHSYGLISLPTFFLSSPDQVEPND